MLRSLLRVVTLSGAVVGVALASFWLYAMQPLVSAGRRMTLTEADPRRLEHHVAYLTGLSPARDASHPEALETAATYITRELASTGCPVSRQPFTVQRRQYSNVVARLGNPSAPLVVVGAHYDVFGDAGSNPGADDNASGVAGLLELARILRDRRLEIALELVAFATEEPPYFGSPSMGSAVHARSLAGHPPCAMVCLEMIGFYTPHQPWPTPLLRLLAPSDGEFVSVAGRPADRALVARVKSGMAGRGEISVASYAGPFVDGLDASDHRNYWALGIPAVMVGDTAFLRNPHYHSAHDTPDTLDYRRMAWVVNGVANTLLSWEAPP